MTPRGYRMTVGPLPSVEGGGFVVVVPDLLGCRSDGETPEDALRNGYDAVAGWIEAAREMGRPVPAAGA